MIEKHGYCRRKEELEDAEAMLPPKWAPLLSSPTKGEEPFGVAVSYSERDDLPEGDFREVAPESPPVSPLAGLHLGCASPGTTSVSTASS